MKHAAPIARLSLAYAAGVAAGIAGAPIWVAPLLALGGMAAPISSSSRPGSRMLALVVAIGCATPVTDRSGTCATEAAGGGAARIDGRFLATPRSGSAPFERLDGCGVVTVVVGDTLIDEGRAGRPVVVRGRWRTGSRRPWVQASTIGARTPDDGPVDRIRWRLVEWRDGLVDRLSRLYGDRAPLVAALVLARREGMDRDVRDAFAVTGIAHLLAISGFHVGVIAGLSLTLLRAFGASRRGARLGAAVIAWAYVGFIGLPDAACRAALILGLVAISRVRGRPPARWGALATAALVLLLADPAKLASAGFQLSFAGAAGLVAWARPIDRALGRRLGRWAPRSAVSACAAGVAATLATLPIVVWHFEKASLVGIPMTLFASPLVSLALPGALASIVLDPVSPAAAAFLAGGVDLLLQTLVTATGTVATLPGVSVWVTRGSVIAGFTGVAVASWVARQPWVGAATRRRLVVAYVVSGIVGWPLAVALEGRGSLELFLMDVGQGDAIGIRTPRGRWLLVDAGPPSDSDPAGHPVVRSLRSRGVRRLEALVLTHPHADHFGGAVPVLRAVAVGRVVDPVLPAPSRSYAELLEEAKAMGVPWTAALAGQSWELDGVTIRVLHPPAGQTREADANSSSVVLLVSWRAFEAILTGDAYTDVERGLMERIGDVDVLKVGHHGSDTSTDSAFLAAIRPELALISLGRGNRYGHPSPEVVERLDAVGAEILRTDEDGDVRVIVGKHGRITVRTGR